MKIIDFHMNLLENHGVFKVFEVWRPQKLIIYFSTNLNHYFYQL